MINTLIVKSNFELNEDFISKYNISNYSIEKLGQIIYCQYHKLPINIQNIIITSKNAINIKELEQLNQSTNFYIISKKLEEILKNYDFNNIFRYKNINDMLINCDISLNYLYLRGKNITQELNLPKLTEIIIYDIKYKNNLSNKAKDIIKSSNLEKIFLFSHLTTINFLNIIIKYNMMHLLKMVKFYIMSEKSIELMKNNNLNYEVIKYEY